MKTQIILLALIAVSLCGCTAVRSAWQSVYTTVDKGLAVAQTITTNSVDAALTPVTH